jgi:hypothetical protein
MSVTLRSLVFTVILGLALPLAADQLLTFAAERKQFNSQLEFFPQEPGREKNLEGGAAYEGRILIGEDSVRADGERDSWIYLRKEKKLLRLHHHDQTYREYDLPIHLDKLQDEKERKATARKIADGRAEITLQKSDEIVPVGSWSARKFTLEVRLAGAHSGIIEVQTWHTTTLGVDTALYDELQRVRLGALPWNKDWQEAELGLPGFAVRRHQERQYEQWRWIRTLELLKIEEVPHAPEAFRPPAEYRRLPFTQPQPPSKDQEP